MRLRQLAELVPARPGRALGVLALVIIIGTVGYWLLAGLSVTDALYQTVTTISTVGFHELVPFDTRTKMFTIGLILSGVGSALYALTLVIEQTLSGDIRSHFYLKRMTMQIERLENHYILCGFGRVGQEIARQLRERAAAFVVVEQTAEHAERARAFGYLVIEGDASDERILNQANISRARCLLAASDSDAGTTYITLTAKSMNPTCYVVARVGYPQNQEKLRLAGADRVLSLYSMGGRRMVLAALQPLAADFMDTLASGRHGDLLLAEFEATPENGLAGQTVETLMKDTPNASLLGVRQRSGGLAIGPRGQTLLNEGDIIIVLAEEADIAALTAPGETVRPLG
ncbi:MAG: NAD-binding protein [Dehalococcoidia bacterium]|nr:NAD-binding protein [Dehalococcoidia bacterium]